MLTLPGIFQSVVKSIVKCQLSVVILTFLFSLFTLTLPPAALAAPPAPAPCQNPQSTDDLTDNYLVGEDGKPPVEYPQLRQTVSADGRVSFYFTVDFSNLQSIFGASNSDYLEGQFQDPEHKSANISELSPAEISKYHGAAQKTSPRAMLDPLKVKYVQYVNTTPTLAEAGDTFTDYNGDNPKTIHDMASTPGFDYPPVPPSSGGDQNTWQNTWGKYWDKIPTAVNEFYEGELVFHYITDAYLSNPPDNFCPDRLQPVRIIKFIVPDFWRTTSTSDQLNTVFVPCAAQSDHISANRTSCGVGSARSSYDDSNNNLLSAAVKFCKNLIGYPKNFVTQLKKTISLIFDNINPVKNAYAATSIGCIKIPGEGKQGKAPYCALPADQLRSGESCQPKTDPNQLDPANQNVICTFYLSFIVDLPPGTPIYILPNFRIPFLAEIWNNALYSDSSEDTSGITGRPGIYSFFTPRVKFLETAKIKQLAKECKDTNFNINKLF